MVFMMNEKRNNWYLVEPNKEFHKKFNCGGRYLYARKARYTDNKVVVFNGRFFIRNFTKEECKNYFVILSKPKEIEQERLDSEYSYYLYY